MRAGFLLSALILGSALIPCSAQFQGSPPSVPSPQNEPIDEALLKTLLTATCPFTRYRIDDMIAISVYGPGYSVPAQRIQDDGTIRLPYIGAVEVAGLTLQELEAKIEDKLKANGIFQNPQVIVDTVAQPWAVVSVEGDVARPGEFPAFSNQTLNQYLSQAGWILDNLASSNLATNSSASGLVTLVRASIGHPVTIPLGPDPQTSPYGQIPLFPGDEIRVGRVGQVYAVGAFKYQGAYALKNTSPTTVIQLMAQAGGIGFEGERGSTSIIRTDAGKQYVLKVNVTKILQGKMADIALEPNDILFVPTNAMKAAIKGGGTSALVSVADTSLIVGH
jgi:polysaccharide export outer membrane protein